MNFFKANIYTGGGNNLLTPTRTLFYIIALQTFFKISLICKYAFIANFVVLCLLFIFSFLGFIR